MVEISDKECAEQVEHALQWVHPQPGIIELRPTNPDGKYESGFYASRSKLVEDAADYWRPGDVLDRQSD